MFYDKNFNTVESVTSGHPDKICDQISDAILDECLRQDPTSRVAAETFGSNGLLVIGGELTTKAKIDFANLAKKVYQDIGHQNELEIIAHITQQSPDIAQGVDTGGAGDQGIMYGYATDETAEFLPRSIVLVHQLTKGLENLRTSKTLPWLKPDGKAQVTMADNKIETIVVSTQHDTQISQEEIHEALKKNLIQPLVGDLTDIKIFINPTGKFTLGGFEADAGLTGRKIMVDTYCGLLPHGGGAFSGKDSTKVDRSAAYMARFAAKNIVAAGLAKECLVSVAYAIGKIEPVMVNAINEKGENLKEIINKFDFRPKAIIERLKLRQPIFQQTAAYGHFGKAGLPWEEVIAI